ncbi:hypothetical protein [Chitinophaga niastensis]|uniref:hypothetical protein n=1 Tax=Chitinophaga niastensis TaxID=536980 RepID=UPI0011B269F9|nr:hypothetical protein [Chitinophaga niastensis]
MRICFVAPPQVFVVSMWTTGQGVKATLHFGKAGLVADFIQSRCLVLRNVSACRGLYAINGTLFLRNTPWTSWIWQLKRKC